MPPLPPGDVTQLLRAWGQGERAAEERLMSAIYDELSRTARILLSQERADHTLEPAALVNETYLRLLRQKHAEWENRAQFFAIAAQMMRRVLLDHAKGRQRAKRGGVMVKLSLSEEIPPASEREVRFEALDDALRDLAAVDSRKAKIIELRFFGGLSVEETAEVLGCSLRTVARDWRMAKAWLMREILGGGD